MIRLIDVLNSPTEIRVGVAKHQSEFRSHRLLDWIGGILSEGLNGKRAFLLIEEIIKVAEMWDELEDELDDERAQLSKLREKIDADFDKSKKGKACEAAEKKVIDMSLKYFGMPQDDGSSSRFDEMREASDALEGMRGETKATHDEEA